MTSNIDLMPVTSSQNEQAGFGKMIVQEIWGDTNTQQGCESLLQLLEGYLDHCDQEQHFASRHTTNMGMNFDLDLIRTIRVVKARPEVLKSALSAELRQDAHAVSLDIAIRLMFSTFVRLADTRIISGTIFQPRWRDSESLVSFLTRVYPQTQSFAALAQDNGRVQIAKFSTSYLSRFANLSIEWTHNLSDHLMLLRGLNWKTLYLFRHPAFLKVSLDTLSRDRMDTTHSLPEALRLGCLPPKLLRETLMTYNLLFPELGDEESRAMLVADCLKKGLDPFFLMLDEHHYNEHETPSDALDPTDVRGLYEKYPYWGYRLYELWKEADDPTPSTRIERWTESRRNPRFTYWCTVVSLTIAIMFGVAATILGALQFWTSYCAWRGCGAVSLGS